MRRVRNRRGSPQTPHNTPHNDAKNPRDRAAARVPQSAEQAVLTVLRKAGRPLRLDEVTAEFGPQGASEVEQQLAELLKRGEVSFGVGHQEYTTIFTSAESTGVPLVVTTDSSSDCAVLASPRTRAMASLIDVC